MSRLREIFHNEITLFSDKWDPYFDVYELYFNKFVEKKPLLVEVGVQGGGSLQMWERYFGDGAKIIGIDHESNYLCHKKNLNNSTEICIGDQSSESFWNKFLNRVSNIDIFIDDGSHKMRDQIVTFENVFPTLNIGGVYVCEDTHTSYWKSCDGGIYSYNTFVEYSKRLIEVVNYEHVGRHELINKRLVEICKDLTSIHFYDSMIVFIKNGKKELKNVHANGHLRNTITA